MKLCQKRFEINFRKRFFAKVAVSHWNSLTRAIVMVPNLLEFKEHMDSALRHTV